MYVVHNEPIPRYTEDSCNVGVWGQDPRFKPKNKSHEHGIDACVCTKVAISLSARRLDKLGEDIAVLLCVCSHTHIYDLRIIIIRFT